MLSDILSLKHWNALFVFNGLLLHRPINVTRLQLHGTSSIQWRIWHKSLVVWDTSTACLLIRSSDAVNISQAFHGTICCYHSMQCWSRPCIQCWTLGTVVTICTTCINTKKLWNWGHRIYLCVSYDCQNIEEIFPKRRHHERLVFTVKHSGFSMFFKHYLGKFQDSECWEDKVSTTNNINVIWWPVKFYLSKR